MFFARCLFPLLIATAGPAFAEARDQLKAPMFSEVILLDMPKGVIETLVKDGGTADFHVIETVGPDQTVTKWLRKLTITGYRGRAGQGAQASIDKIVETARARCKGSSNARKIGTARWGGHPAAGAVLSCDRDETNGPPRSETAAIWVVEGRVDLYVFRWAEAVAPGNPGSFADTAYWNGVAQTLGRGMSFHPN